MTLYTYRGRVINEYDGDTITFDIDLGFGIRLPGEDWHGKTELSCRVFGINAPEKNTPEGKQALAYAQTLVPLGTICTVTSHNWDKYGGRYDGDVTLPDGSDFATRMVNAGHAVRKVYT